MPSRFVCFTAYHLLMAEAIARQAAILDAEVIWVDEPGLGDAVDGILAGGPLRIVLRLAPIGATRGWGRSFVYVTNRRSLRRWMRHQAPGALFVFNPLRPETRALAERLARSRHFVEDGLEAYVANSPLRRQEHWLRRAASIVMGVRPFLKRDFIEYGDWHEAWALLPERVYAPPRTTLPPMKAIDRTILNAVIERWGAPSHAALPTAPSRVLVMLDHPDQVAGLTVDRAIGIASRWGVGPESMVVKPHPRDPRSLASIIAGRGVQGIEGRWPVEATLAHLPEGGAVLGGNSSGMLLAAVLRPDLDLRLRATKASALWGLLESIDARARLEPDLDG